MKKASNHAAQALQVLRELRYHRHGDLTAYDAVKWSSAICGLLESSISPTDVMHAWGERKFRR